MSASCLLPPALTFRPSRPSSRSPGLFADESKVGAFGVGFYSLFSISEEPFVRSGSSWMGFYWKDGGDQVRRFLPPFARAL